MRRLTFIIFLAAMVNMASCQTPGEHHEAVKQNIPVAEFEQKLAATSNAQLVDVRTPEEYAAGHLKNAVNIDYNGDDFVGKIGKLDKGKPVLVYCLSGGRSSKAASKMEDMGFAEVYNMEGGMMKWNGADKPVDKGTAAAVRGMTAEQLTKLTTDAKYVLVDYNARWCEPCKKMLPVLEAFAEKRKDKLALVKIDADENSELMKQKGISGIPYLELYEHGKLTWSHSGFIEESDLLRETKL